MMEMVKKQKILVTMLVVYAGLLLFRADLAWQALDHTWYYVVEMLEIMPVIFVLTALIEAWVPRSAIERGFGHASGAGGAIRAFVLGSLSAGPIYAAFPVCKTLLRKGASVYNIVIILSAWAVIKVPMLANEAKFLGVKYMAIRWALTVLSIVGIAWLTDKRNRTEDVIQAGRSGEGEPANRVLWLDEKGCIGCGVCHRVSPDHFRMEAKKAVVCKQPAPEEVQTLEELSDKCPARSIHVNRYAI